VATTYHRSGCDQERDIVDWHMSFTVTVRSLKLLNPINPSSCTYHRSECDQDRDIEDWLAYVLSSDGPVIKPYSIGSKSYHVLSLAEYLLLICLLLQSAATHCSFCSECDCEGEKDWHMSNTLSFQSLSPTRSNSICSLSSDSLP